MAMVSLETVLGELIIVGLYAPAHSLDETSNDVALRTLFQGEVLNALAELSPPGLSREVAVLGDLNVVERDHLPRQAMFAEADYWFYEGFLRAGLHDCFRKLNPRVHEHSWYGTGPFQTQQRIDHAFLSTGLAHRAIYCRYEHAPRNSRLSDHAALVLEVQTVPPSIPVKSASV